MNITAKWVNIQPDEKGRTVKCSFCHAWVKEQNYCDDNFCYNCGAKMDNGKMDLAEFEKTIEQKNNEIKLWKDLTFELARLLKLHQSSCATIDSQNRYDCYGKDPTWKRFSDGYYSEVYNGYFIHYDADKNPYRNISQSGE